MPENRYVGSFVAVDVSGNKYTIHEYMKVTHGRGSSGSHSTPTAKELRTDDGRHVHRVGKGVYDILGFETIRVTSDDSAP
jgi:hypothetical protein